SSARLGLRPTPQRNGLREARTYHRRFKTQRKPVTRHHPKRAASGSCAPIHRCSPTSLRPKVRPPATIPHAMAGTFRAGHARQSANGHAPHGPTTMNRNAAVEPWKGATKGGRVFTRNVYLKQPRQPSVLSALG